MHNLPAIGHSIIRHLFVVTVHESQGNFEGIATERYK